MYDVCVDGGSRGLDRSIILFSVLFFFCYYCCWISFSFFLELSYQAERGLSVQLNNLCQQNINFNESTATDIHIRVGDKSNIHVIILQQIHFDSRAARSDQGSSRFHRSLPTIYCQILDHPFLTLISLSLSRLAHSLSVSLSHKHSVASACTTDKITPSSSYLISVCSRPFRNHNSRQPYMSIHDHITFPSIPPTSSW